MKSILYVAATLMIGASIYGFVDYNKASRQKQFKSMYKEDEVVQPVKEQIKQPVTNQPDAALSKQLVEAKTEQPAVKAGKKKKRSVVVESFSRAPLREKKEVVIVPAETKEKEQ